MTAIVTAKNINKRFGRHQILRGINLDIPAGKIVGLVGPNGAGKTTLLQALLGLSVAAGDISVMGRDPRKERAAMLEDVCFIADTATLPRWISVEQLLEYVAGIHPKFSRQRAEKFLADTKIRHSAKVRQLSKGMVTQLHLALVMAIDAKLLVLDEPTLGLDIVYRRRFYDALLNDFYDQDRTIIITTHQVEEIEHLLTDVLFIHDGEIVLDQTLESFEGRFLKLIAGQDTQQQARSLHPIMESRALAGREFIFEGRSVDELMALGEVSMASLAEVFVAKVTGVGGAAEKHS
ncbi:ABC transporter ATP-binding protein [Gilvimarinus sp. SDUM040013]|uniref:ABC transporter ATP-binding protein n=1 Tax=Gilvimarinus gilvus TaxID=3058038 RepID=A0ABU4RZI3_9GAMM|nr:ABC transporter ATP-binding protein [Gilvimarinus sp. SDUM040013]MDO3388671.1 ABC transporter ATP-binding protein [Gilvimarinus sp. SDUM040013]MDX6849566.1 ABC transporter ATP-binding protein [Gilvimarinus sp. SDUM040013]